MKAAPLVASTALAAAAALALFGAADTARAAEGRAAHGARVVAEDLRGVTIEYVAGRAQFDTLAVGTARYQRVRVAGASVLEAPGRPSLPTDIVSIAVPDGMSARVRVDGELSSDRPGIPPAPVPFERIVKDDPRTGPASEYRYEPESAIYSGVRPYPENVAIVAAGNAVGELWVVPIRVTPVRWNPSNRTYRVLERMTLRVDFVPATDRERALRATPRPGTDTEPWRRIQRGIVVNYASARTFPQRPREFPRAAFARRLLDGNPEFRISVTQSEWKAVPYEALSAKGFPAGISIAKIGVWERGYDDTGDSATAVAIPVVARDANTNGTFDAGDAITFYGRSLRDRVGAGSIENRYSDANAYWLTWTNADAAVPDTIDGNIPTGSFTSPTFFRQNLHLEQDLYLLASPNQTVGSPPENVSYLFWSNGDFIDAPESFQAPILFADAEPSQPFRIQARYQGGAASFHRLNIFYQSSTGQSDTLALGAVSFNQEVYVLDTGFTIPGAHIGPGVNQYLFTGDHQPSFGGPFQWGSQTYLDWIDVDYSRKYVARNNVLAFTSNGSGSVAEITVSGFSVPNIEIYDVTVPAAPERVVRTSAVVGTPGNYVISFRTDAFAGERRFVAMVSGAAAPVASGDVEADIASNLRTPGVFGGASTARSLMIAPHDFLPAATRLANHRRGQGYVVELADVQDVYDEFNGGVKSARAIRRYIRHAYQAWTPRPAFVVLMGDGSLDYKHRLSTSAVDWVPTYLHFEWVAGPPGAELVAEDPYYSIDLAQPEPVADNDVTPDIMVGRVPASSNAELDAFVTKLIQYESYQPTDTWRGRQLLVSDDTFSTGLFGAASYCSQPQEILFRDSNQHVADAASASASGQDIQSIFWDLKTYTDAVPTYIDGFGNTCRSLQEVGIALGQTGGGYDQLASRLTQGALIVNVQAHANRYLVAHEQIYCTGNPFFCTGPVNPDRVQNVGRPFLWMVWGCHANQFPDGPFRAAIDSSDAEGEQLLLLPDRGSIVSFGSSGYEFLQTNSTFNDFVAEAFYTVPPTTPGPNGQARWIAGELYQHAFLRNANTGFTTQEAMNRTLHVLGDPMTRIDALPPRVWEVSLDGTVVASGAPLTSNSPTDSIALVAKVRDEVAVTRVAMVERPVGGLATGLDSTLFTVAFSDTARQATITGKVRPRVGNYDLLVQATDLNGRTQEFPLAVRTPIRYFANGVEIINGVFVASTSLLRAEITSPIPLTADSLSLLLDGVLIAAAPTALDGTGRRWALESLAGDRGPGTHTLQAAVGGRTAGLDQATFQVSAQFTLRGVAVVDPRRQGAGCGGSIFQYELSAPASRVELQLYTVSGRRVATYSLPGAAGFNVYCWDGRDSQGHTTATGLYLFRLRATDASGKSADHNGRMIRSR